MVDLLEEATRLEVFVLDEVLDRGDRCERHAQRLGELDDLIDFLRVQEGLDQFIDFLPSDHALLAALEERVLVEFGVLHKQRHGRDAALLREAALGEAAGARYDHDVTVLAGHDVHGVAEDVARVVAPADGSLEGVHAGVVLVGAGGGFGERNVDVLTFAVLGSIGERGEGSDPGVNARDVVSRCAACRERLAIGVARVVHDGAHGHGREAVAAVVLVRACAAEWRDGYVHEVGQVVLEIVVGEAEFGHARLAVALDEDVGFGKQLLEQRTAGVRLEVECHALLAGVEVEEEAALFRMGLVVREGAELPRDVTRGRFDLDYLGSEAGEEFGAVRPGDPLGEIDNAYV